MGFEDVMKCFYGTFNFFAMNMQNKLKECNTASVHVIVGDALILSESLSF